MNNSKFLNKQVHNFIMLSLWIVSFQLIGFTMGQFTKSNIATWYDTLNKSPLTPPNISFGIIWTILYCFLAYIGYYIFIFTQKKLKKIRLFYTGHMLLNWSWTPIFFITHQCNLGLMVLTLMVMTNTYLTLVFYKKAKLIFVLSTIYQVWISFAWYLNFYIVLNN